jgi:hypothetical protein
MSDEGRLACQIHRDENGDVFVLIDGMKIAKRGLPDTAHADTWIMLERGWFVRDGAMTNRRFAAQWRADKMPGGYVVRDANGQSWSNC